MASHVALAAATVITITITTTTVATTTKVLHIDGCNPQPIG